MQRKENLERNLEILFLSKNFQKLMNALSNANSIKILQLLETRNMSVGELAEKLSLGLNTLKYNLYSLLEVGLIRISVTKWSQTERKIKIYEPVEKILVLVPGRSSAGNGSI